MISSLYNNNNNSNKSARFLSDQTTRPFQDFTMDSNGRVNTSNTSNSNNKMFWQSFGNNTPYSTSIAANSNNSTANNNNSFSYNNDQFYSLVGNSRPSYEETSPALQSQIVVAQPQTSYQPPFQQHQQEEYQHAPPPSAQHTQSAYLSELPSAQLPIPQPLLMPQLGQTSVKDDNYYTRQNRANSTSKNSTRYSSRFSSEGSTSSSVDESNGGSHNRASSNSISGGGAKRKTKRSRMGCLTCRHRKKRCCETKPRCTECSRLGLNCTWPVPGTEHKNRSKNNRFNHDEMYHSEFGPIKILRGVVAYKVD